MSTTFMQKKEAVVRKWYIIDAAGKPLGKTAAAAATLPLPLPICFAVRTHLSLLLTLTAVTLLSSSTPRTLC